MSSEVEQIKDRLGIVDIVSGYIKLEKAGKNFRARCPFHHEKTPSFFVSPVRNSYYCFGCGAKGDIFTIAQHFEGLDFLGALKLLGDRAGVNIQHTTRISADNKTRLYNILEEATLFYQRELLGNESVTKYLRGRGLQDKTVASFRIGFAKDGWRNLYQHLKAKKFTDDEIEKAGLIKLPDNDTNKKERYYDRFRSRIMFPISDGVGRIVAFSGRIFPKGTDNIAKYVNSPETQLFSKSRILYGLDRAKSAIRKFNFSIIVEGQMDLLMSHQSSFSNTVALSGTALTETQIDQLKRLSKNVVLAFDSDSAGIASSGRSAELLLAHGLDVKVAKLPGGVDPADLARKGTEHLKKAIRESEHIITFYLNLLSSKYKDNMTFGKKVEQIIMPFIAQISSKIDQAYFVREVAGRLNVSEDIIWDSVKSVPIKSYFEDAEIEVNAAEPTVSREDAIKRKVAAIIFWQDSLENQDIDTKDIKKRLKDIVGSDIYTALIKAPEAVAEEQRFIEEVGFEEIKSLQEELDELLLHLTILQLEKEYKKQLVELRTAEQKDDQSIVKNKLKACNDISMQLQKLRTRESVA